MPLLTRTGAAATKANIITDVRAAFVAAGWSETGPLAATGDEYSYGYPSGTETQYIAVNFAADGGDTNPFASVPTWGQAIGSSFDTQPRGPSDAVGVVNSQSRARGMSNTNVNSWVFYDEPVANVVSYVHVVIEPSAGIFVHWCNGVVEKAGAFSNGCYTTGNAGRFEQDLQNDCNFPFTQPFGGNPDGADWLAVDPTAVGSNVFGQEASAGTGGGAIEFVKSVFWEFKQQANEFTDDNLLCQSLQLSGLDQRTGLTPLNPIYLGLTENTANFRVIVGTIPDARYANIEGLGTDLKIITVGADSWYAFPLFRAGVESLVQFQGGGGTLSSSGMYGLAYKLVP